MKPRTRLLGWLMIVIGNVSIVALVGTGVALVVMGNKDVAERLVSNFAIASLLVIFIGILMCIFPKTNEEKEEKRKRVKSNMSVSQKLEYTFKVMCDVPRSSMDHYNNGWFEEHYEQEEQEVDFEYEISVAFDDYLDYAKPHDYNVLSKEEQDSIMEELKKQFEDFEGAMEIDDDDFIDYLKDKYEDEARVECEKSWQN